MTCRNNPVVQSTVKRGGGSFLVAACGDQRAVQVDDQPAGRSFPAPSSHGNRPDREGCLAAMAASPSTAERAATARRAPTAGTTGTGAARRAEGSAASGFAHACLHRGEPDGWRAPRGSPGDQVGAGRRPGRQSSVVAVLRADRAGGDTKTPRSRRALKLAQVAVGALQEWQVDQAAEREAAGSHWQDTGRVVATAAGTPLGARQRKEPASDI